MINPLCFLFLDLKSHSFAAEFKMTVEGIIILLYSYTLQVAPQLLDRTHLFCFNMIAYFISQLFSAKKFQWIFWFCLRYFSSNSKNYLKRVISLRDRPSPLIVLFFFASFFFFCFWSVYLGTLIKLIDSWFVKFSCWSNCCKGKLSCIQALCSCSIRFNASISNLLTVGADMCTSFKLIVLFTLFSVFLLMRRYFLFLLLLMTTSLM